MPKNIIEVIVLTDKAIRQYTLLEIARRTFPHNPHFEDEDIVHKVVDNALSANATKLERVAAFERAASIYDTGVNTPLDRLWPSMVEGDHELAIDILIDKWFQHCVIVEDFLFPHLETTHHPERLRQLLGVLAYETHESLSIAIESVENPQHGRQGLPRLRSSLIEKYDHIGKNLQRLVAMRYRDDEVREFAIGITVDIANAAEKSALTPRKAAKCARPFVAIGCLPLTPPTASTALHRNAPRNG